MSASSRGMYWTGGSVASLSGSARVVSATTRPLKRTRTRFVVGSIVTGCPFGRSILASFDVGCLADWTVPSRTDLRRTARLFEKIPFVHAKEREQERDHQRPGDDPEQPEHGDASEEREKHEPRVHLHLPSHRERLDHVVRERQQHPAPDADEEGRRHVASELD